MVEKKVTAITVTASTGTRRPRSKHYGARVGDGKIIVGGLSDDEDYTLTTHVFTKSGLCVTSTIHVTMGQTSKSIPSLSTALLCEYLDALVSQSFYYMWFGGLRRES